MDIRSLLVDVSTESQNSTSPDIGISILISTRKQILESAIRNRHFQNSNLSDYHKELAQKSHKELIMCLEMIPEVKSFNDITQGFYKDADGKNPLYRLATGEIDPNFRVWHSAEGDIGIIRLEGFDPARFISSKGESGQGVTYIEPGADPMLLGQFLHC